MPDPNTDENTPLHPERLTWAVLLARWVEFARSAVALPTDAAGRRWRNAVPDIINLQAVWFSLEHFDELDPAQRSLGLDRARVLIDKHAGALRHAWKDRPLPGELKDLIADAEEALAKQRGAADSA